jgi:CheY-like chemotaxis protein/HPt (histidine-containing phosphotransfer) domain-containing protein
MNLSDGTSLSHRLAVDTQLQSVPLVLLTSARQRGDENGLASGIFAAQLLKPITHRELTQCLMKIVAPQPEPIQQITQPMGVSDAGPFMSEQATQPLLLVDDNPVNQKVARRTLEKLGYTVDVAADGQAAVQAWRTGHYRLILMDCQMPVLDGYEATREIRRLEQGARVPIIALTAHAMKDADVECRLAGMDDYLSKPINRSQLESCLQRWLMDAPDALRLHAARITDDEPSADDRQWEELLKASDYDEAFARELATLFIESGLNTVEQILSALNTGDYACIGAKAHSLKGASANLHATALRDSAERLEVAAKVADVKQMRELSTAVSQEFDRTVNYLSRRIG